ncbi:MAG: hypothetical protein LUF78_04370 [Clostridiales bacterium]|nr:hypothetical protein [Clostridiales bacterium]
MLNRRIRNTVGIVLTIVLAGVLLLMIYTEKKIEGEKETAYQTLLAEVEPYEDELREKKILLSNLKSDVSYSSEESEILVGFVATDESDLAYMEEKADIYGFSPVLVLNCTMEESTIEDMIDTADDSWEIMLYTPTFSEEVNESVLSVISYLDSIDRAYADVFFLRSDYDSDTNLRLIKKDGFIGYTSYHSEAPGIGQEEDGTVYFDYSYLTSSGTSVTSRISAMYNGRASMIFALDMKSINSGSLTEEYVTSVLDTLQSYTENDDCSFSTITSVVEKLSDINSIEASNQESYEKQVVELEERIEELEEIIDELYDNYEG